MDRRTELVDLEHTHEPQQPPTIEQKVDFLYDLVIRSQKEQIERERPKWRRTQNERLKQAAKIQAKTPLFETESDMVAHYAKNLHLIEPGLELFCTDGEPGLDCPVDFKASRSPCIDILALDRQERMVVIECKIGRGNPAVVAQAGAYRAWLLEHLAGPDDPVRAIAIVKVASPMLKLLLRNQPAPWLTVYEFAPDATLTPISLSPLGERG